MAVRRAGVAAADPALGRRRQECVVAVGEGVTRWREGDRVAGTFFQNWQTGPVRREAFHSALGGTLNGMLAEYVTLSSEGVVATPPHLSFEEAAT